MTTSYLISADEASLLNRRLTATGRTAHTEPSPDGKVMVTISGAPTVALEELLIELAPSARRVETALS